MAKADDTATTRGMETSWSGDALLGTQLGDRYTLDRQIGQGGFGIVFEATDERLQKRVAVKVLSPSIAQHGQAVTRFKQEAIAAARIGHPGIVDVTDFGLDATGIHFLVMEFVNGVDLSSVVKAEAPFALARSLVIAVRIGQALAAAHGRGIVHRDLKPANVLLMSLGGVSDFVKILDFGISKVTSTDSTNTTLTGAGQVLGTPKYMAPEQGMANRTVDGRADVYALAVMTFEMLTGRTPHSGDTPYEIMHNKLSHDPLSASLVAPDRDIPLSLDRVLDKALKRNPEERQRTMAELEESLRAELRAVDEEAAASVKPSAIAQVAARSSDAPPASVNTESLGPAAAAADREVPTTATVAPGRGGAVTVTIPRRKLALWACVVVAALAAIGVWLGLRGDGAERDAVAPPAAAVAPADAAAAPADEAVELRLDITPASATVELDGVATTDNPIRLPRSERIHELAVSAPGFVTETRKIGAVTGGDVVVELAPAPADAGAPPRRKRKRPRKSGPGGLPDSPL